MNISAKRSGQASPASQLQALIFDVDGTLADTEMAHLAAFNHSFAELGMGWHWDEALYTQLLEISGGKERVAHYWKQHNAGIQAISTSAIDETTAHIHELKTAHYEQAVQDGAVQMRPGVLALMQEAHAAGLSLSIATTTSSINVAALLRKAIGADWRTYFAVIEDASTSAIKKPHPQVYLQTLKHLNLPASACVAFEDSANGLQSALAAGLRVVVTPNRFTAHHVFTGASLVLPDLSGTSLARLQQNF